MSKALSLSPGYISREFSKYFNSLSFGEYIRRLRIDKFKELLDSGTHSLAEIAYLTGFSDQSHFIRVFKKDTGVTPSHYQNIGEAKQENALAVVNAEPHW